MCYKKYYRGIFTVCVIYFSEFYGKEADYPKKEDINSFIFHRLERGQGITFSSINKEGLIKSADGKLYTECCPQEKQDAKHVGCDGTTVMNADLRQRVIPEGWPVCLIGKLEIHINKSKKIASGILVGPNHVLTCAHNVFNTHSFAERILFYPGSSPENNPYNWFEVAGYFIESGFLKENPPHDYKVEDYDLALLVLTRPACFKGKRIGYAGIHCLLKDDMFYGSSQFQVSGYPVNKKEKEGYVMYAQTGSIAKVEERTLHYNIGASPGQSGAPIWMNVESEPRVYGVHTHGTDSLNYGTRITEAFFTELVDWISQTWMIVSSGEQLQPSLGSLDVQTSAIPSARATPQSTQKESATHTSVIDILTALHPCMNPIPWYIKELFPRELRHMDFVLDTMPTAVHYQVSDFFDLGCEGISLPHPPFKRYHSIDVVESMQKHFAYMEKHYQDNPEKLHIQTCALQKVIVYYAAIIVDVIKAEGKNPYEDYLWINLYDLYQTNLLNINKTGRKWSIDYKTRKNTCVVNRPQINNNFIESFMHATCESYLTKLYRDLVAQETVVITGMGGVGKSTLAAQFAQEAVKNQAFEVVCWVNAETQEGIRSAYLKVIDWIDGVNERHHGCPSKLIMSYLAI
ncbi:MAG: trypsin-like peptidase domain-containing protein [Alphaproteobacteria bacterium]|nr:trypsin-like peptidase domain-containing protein [Alphaproteobacteria bacterium]